MTSHYVLLVLVLAMLALDIASGSSWWHLMLSGLLAVMVLWQIWQMRRRSSERVQGSPPSLSRA